MSIQTIARRYASALADVVIENGEATEIQQELEQWSAVLSANPNLQEVLRNPTIPLDQKRAVLNQLIARAQPRPTTANFLKVMLQNQRLTELPEINRKFAEILDERAGMVAATITSAHPVPDELQRQLTEKLASVTQKKVRLNFEQDTDLIGGLVTRIGSTVYDGSVRNQLDQIKEKMTG